MAIRLVPRHLAGGASSQRPGRRRTNRLRFRRAKEAFPSRRRMDAKWPDFDGLVTRSLMYNRRIVNPPCKEAEGGELFERGLLVNLGGVVRRSVSNSEEASTTK